MILPDSCNKLHATLSGWFCLVRTARCTLHCLGNFALFVQHVARDVGLITFWILVACILMHEIPFRSFWWMGKNVPNDDRTFNHVVWLVPFFSCNKLHATVWVISPCSCNNVARDVGSITFWILIACILMHEIPFRSFWWWMDKNVPTMTVPLSTSFV